MRIYLASIYNGGLSSPDRGTVDMRMTEKLRYPFVLESFAYMDARMVKTIRGNKQKIFLDSGAFTDWSKGNVTSLRLYAERIVEYHDIIEVAANLDAIGADKEQLSYSRLKELKRLLRDDGLDHLVIPVHHVRDHDDWLKRYLDDGHDYIALGGMVPENNATLKRWLDHVWDKYLANGKVRVHGFGMTRLPLMTRYPWHSIDSTSWLHIANGGSLMMDFVQDDHSIMDFKIDFSRRSGSKPLHYKSMSWSDRITVDRRLEQLEAERIKDPKLEADFAAKYGCDLGFNPTALSKSYGLRWLGNIGYFHRLMLRSGKPLYSALSLV